MYIVHTPYFHARPQFTHFILNLKKVGNCSKKWISLLNKVDFENIKTQVATLKRLTEKQYDRKFNISTLFLTKLSGGMIINKR